jgi:arylsulfatase A-like enzyme
MRRIPWAQIGCLGAFCALGGGCSDREPSAQPPIENRELLFDVVAGDLPWKAEGAEHSSLVSVQWFTPGIRPEEKDKQHQRIASRLGFLMQPEGSVSFRTTPPADACLAYSVNLDSSAHAAGSDGMTFRVLIDGGTVAEHTLTAEPLASDELWPGLAVDLGPFAGREIAITLAADAGPTGDATGDLGGFTRVLLERRRPVPRRAARRERPNVLVIAVDTLRASALGCYGAQRDTSPNVDRLAGEGLLFARAISPSSWTVPAVGSFFTGLLPREHELQQSKGLPLARSHEALAERLSAAGITTGAFVSNVLLTPSRNFDQGFESYLEVRPQDARTLHAAALRWIREQQGSQWFAYVHALEPHDPYVPHADVTERFVDADDPYQGPYPKASIRKLLDIVQRLRAEDASAIAPRDLEHFRSLYDGEVAWWDARLGELLADLDAQGQLDDTVVVITSDHGEEFLEHGLLLHGQSLFEELVHVPLILWGPGIVPAGRVEAAVGTVTLHRTVCELMGVEPAGAGPSLLAVARGDAAPGPILLDTLKGRRPGDKTAHRLDGVRTDRWKLLRHQVEPMRYELYDLSVDPGEQDDLLIEAGRKTSDGTPASVLLEELAPRLGQPGTGVQESSTRPDGEMLNLLRDLGYLDAADEH